MSRTIKFRGKIKGINEWAHGSLIIFPDGEYNILSRRSEKSNKLSDWNVDPDTVGQFTGLIDNNGKEIYEGDIIKLVESSLDTKAEIVYNEEMTAFCLRLQHSNACGCRSLGDWCSLGYEITIVGNIHDNLTMKGGINE